MKRNKGWALLTVSAATSHSFLEAVSLCLFLDFQLSVWSVPSSTMYVREVNSGCLFFPVLSFSLGLSVCLSLAYSSLYSIRDRSISCKDAQLLWNALIPLAYVQDIVSVPFKSNGFRTGKALISAAHCCICVDARCWPYLLSGLRESVCFPLKPSALHNSLAARVCMTEMARQIKKGLHRENEVEAACWEKDRRNATGIWWLVGQRRGKWQRVRGSNWFG